MYNYKTQAAHAMLDAGIQATGGRTLNPSNLQDVTEGYAVGLGGASPITIGEFEDATPEAMQAVHLAIDWAARHNGAVGAWMFEDMIWIEPVQVFDNQREAMMTAAIRGEVAVFHLNTGTEIPVQ